LPHALAGEALQHLGDAGCSTTRSNDVNAAVVGKTSGGSGSSGNGRAARAVVSYDFLLRQNLNGFVRQLRAFPSASPLVCDSSIRIGGAQVASVVSQGRLRPQAPGLRLHAKLDEQY